MVYYMKNKGVVGCGYYVTTCDGVNILEVSPGFINMNLHE